MIHATSFTKNKGLPGEITLPEAKSNFNLQPLVFEHRTIIFEAS